MGTFLEEYSSSSDLSLDTEKPALAARLRRCADVGETYGNLRLMIAYDLEFAPNTDEAHKKVVYGLFPEPRLLLSAYRTARREHNMADLVLVCPHMNPDELFAGPRVSMSRYLQALKFPAPLMSAHSMVKLPKDSDAFWLVIPIQDQIPVMVVMFPMAYEQVPEGVQLTGEA